MLGRAPVSSVPSGTLADPSNLKQGVAAFLGQGTAAAEGTRFTNRVEFLATGSMVADGSTAFVDLTSRPGAIIVYAVEVNLWQVADRVVQT